MEENIVTAPTPEVPEEASEKPRLYKIGEFAKMFGLSIQTIRNYQRKGILPERRNSINKYRVFTDEDIEVMRGIMKIND